MVPQQDKNAHQNGTSVLSYKFCTTKLTPVVVLIPAGGLLFLSCFCVIFLEALA